MPFGWFSSFTRGRQLDPPPAAGKAKRRKANKRARAARRAGRR